MPLSKDDRIAFSLQIVSSVEQIKGLEMAKAQLQLEIVKALKLDTANKNLFDPVNSLVNNYQSELAQLNGIVRTTFAEQDIQDSANKKIKNYFFPNDVSTVVPSLSATQNIWTKVKPFAMTYAIGKTYVETYPSTVPTESDSATPVLSLISSASAYSDMENTTGQHCIVTGSCSNPMYTDQATCVLNGSSWTPGPDAIVTYAPVQTLKDDLIAAVNSYKAFLLAEVALIPTNDPNSAQQAQNDAAINNINNVIIPALNAWLAFADFNTAHGQTTCAGFNGYNANLLAPTKLHSVQLAALQSAINTRQSYSSTRLAQVLASLGDISQNISTGELNSSSGLYGKRYGILLLRLNIMGGSLFNLIGMQTASGAQDAIKANIISSRDTYMTIVPTSILAAPASGTAIVNLVDASFLNVGDTVWIMAEGQEELQRAVKAISGKMVTLNDIIPSKYRPIDKARLYKDLT